MAKRALFSFAIVLCMGLVLPLMTQVESVSVARLATDTAPIALLDASSDESSNWENYVDLDYGYSVRYPSEMWDVVVDLENTGAPEYVIKRRVSLLGPQGARINIDIWRNASELTLMEWFEEHQRPLLARGVAPAQPNATVAGMPAVFTVEPEGPQAPRRIATCFQHEERAFRLEYWAFDGGIAQETYQETLANFEFTDAAGVGGAVLPAISLQISSSGLTGDSSCCGYGASGNPYSCGCGSGNGCGNCTWWAWYKRASIGDPLSASSWGNAHEWDTRARDAGWAVVEGPPAEKAIIVLERGEQGADSTYGHVAYVEQTIGDNNCRVSDMWYSDRYGNCGCEGVCCRVCTWYQYHTNGSRVHFIYPSSPQVKLYDQANYQGNVVFSGGAGFSNDPNADSYSMEIPSGWSVKTWRGDNRSGEERCWSKSVPNLQDHGWHSAIQSIEVFDRNVCSGTGSQVKLYDQANYQGSVVFSEGTWFSNDPNANSYSMEIPGGQDVARR
jgi:hypothetical protein